MNLTNFEMFSWIDDWMEEEPERPILGVLATSERNQPFSRTVATRLVFEKGILFFTQKGSKKVGQLKENPLVSLTMILFEKRRQITLRGKAHPLSAAENETYWKEYPQDMKLRFLSYGPESGNAIEEQEYLDRKHEEYKEQYGERPPEKPDAYIGYLIVPDIVEFYDRHFEKISESFQAKRRKNDWVLTRVVP